MNNKKGAAQIFVVIMLIGATLIAAGVMSTIRNKEYTKYYVETKGVFSGTDIYSSDYDGTTYSLQYEYVVDGEKYYIATDYGTGIIPKDGTVKTIRYNPDNPSEAVIAGNTTSMIFYVIGFMFFFIPLVFIVTESNSKEADERKRKMKERLIPILMGVIFAGLGIGVYFLMCSGSDDISLKSAWNTSGFLIVIPILFAVVGIYILFSSILPRKAKEIVVKVEEIIDLENGAYNIIFADQTETLIGEKTGMYGRYIYNTNQVNKFSKDKKFRFNLYKYSVMFQIVRVSEVVSYISLNMFNDEDFEEVM